MLAARTAVHLHSYRRSIHTPLHDTPVALTTSSVGMCQASSDCHSTAQGWWSQLGLALGKGPCQHRSCRRKALHSPMRTQPLSFTAAISDALQQSAPSAPCMTCWTSLAKVRQRLTWSYICLSYDRESLRSMSTGWLRMSAAVEGCLPNRRAKGLSSGGNVMPSTISPGGRNCTRNEGCARAAEAQLSA